MNTNEPRSQSPLNRYMSQFSQKAESGIRETLAFNTKVMPANEYSKNKIGELQEEVQRLRKEMTQRECIWSKQKNQLLNKAEILNLQIVQLKQRQSQLVKVNQTLEMALGSREKSADTTHREDDIHWQGVQQELAEKSKIIKELRRTIEEMKKKVSFAEDERSRANEQKEKKINALTSANKELAIEHQNRINSLKKELNSLPFNREIMSTIFKIFNAHLAPQELTYEDLLQDRYYESPVTKRFDKDWSQNLKQKNSNNSFSRMSGHSFISELNSNKLPSECSEDEGEGEKLLCEICKKVYAQRQFIIHMEECNRLKLQQNRLKLEKDLRDLNNEHRKSLSQLKRKNTKQYDNPLRELVSNANRDNSSNSKMQKKPSKLIKQPQEKPANLSQIFTNEYRSTKFF